MHKHITIQRLKKKQLDKTFRETLALFLKAIFLSSNDTFAILCAVLSPLSIRS